MSSSDPNETPMIEAPEVPAFVEPPAPDLSREVVAAEPARMVSELPSGALWEHMSRVVHDLADSDLVPPALRRKPANVLLVALAARDLGISLTTGLRQIQVIEGQPSISAQLMGALIRRDGHRLEGRVERDDKNRPIRAVIVGTRLHADGNPETMEADYTIHDAVGAGLCTYDETAGNGVRARSSSGKPLPWEQHTSSMLWARAMSTIGRRLFSDVLNGLTYTPEELQPDYVWSSGGDTSVATAPEPLTDEQRDHLNAKMKALTDVERKAVNAALADHAERGLIPPRAEIGAVSFPNVLAVIDEALAIHRAAAATTDDTVEDAEVVEEPSLADLAASLATGAVKEYAADDPERPFDSTETTPDVAGYITPMEIPDDVLASYLAVVAKMDDADVNEALNELNIGSVAGSERETLARILATQDLAG